MAKCSSCKGEYTTGRVRCPYCGTQGLHSFKQCIEPQFGHCAECDKGQRTAPAECQFCGQTVHRACLKKHAERCVRADYEAFIDDYPHEL